MRTLDDLANEVAVRLGFGAQGGASIIQRPLLYSALRSAQTQLYEEFGQELLLVVNDYDPAFLVAGESLYDFPDDCDPNRITSVSICSGGRYSEIDRGIGTLRRNAHDSCSGNDPDAATNTCGALADAAQAPTPHRARPYRWDMRLGNDKAKHDDTLPPDDPHGDLRVGQLEVWPTPDKNYAIRLTYYRKMMPFSDGSDKASVTEELLLLHALVNMKSHYRQPDAQVYAGQLNNMLGRIKGKQLDGLRFNKKRQRFRTGTSQGRDVSGGFRFEYTSGGITLVSQDTVDTEQEGYVPVITEDSV